MPQSRKLSEEDFAGWLAHPVTRALHAFLQQGINQAAEDWLAGGLVLEDNWKSGMKQANTIGRCEMARTILNLEVIQLGDFDEK